MAAGLTQQKVPTPLYSTVQPAFLNPSFTPTVTPPHLESMSADIPVRIDWKVLDDQLLQHFWQQQQQGPFASTSIDSSSSSIDPLSSSSDLLWPSQQQEEQQQHVLASLSRDDLPDFSDRLLVFHRGVGVATAPGLYLTQKLDMLVEYLVIKPITDALDSAVSAVRGFLGQQQQGQQGQQQQQREQQPLRSPSLSGVGRTFSLSSAGDVDHRAARVVVRRSLSSLMPGPQQVLARFWEPLVLQVKRGGGRGAFPLNKRQSCACRRLLLRV